LISFTLDLRIREYTHRVTRFNLLKKNHGIFVQEYEAKFSQRVEVSEDPDTLAIQINEDITYAAIRYAPRTKPRKKVTPPWWSPELTRKRRGASGSETQGSRR